MPVTSVDTSTEPGAEPGDSSKPFLLVALGFIAACAVAVAFFCALIGDMKDHRAGFWAMMAVTLAFGMVIIAICAAFAGAARKYAGCIPTPAARRYSRRFILAAGVYVLMLTVAIGAYKRLHPIGLLAYALAVGPALPLVAAVAVMGLYLREETDEFERAVKSESALWATGGLLCVATVWGFLEMFHLVPHVESWVVFPIWALFLAPAEILSRRRYR